MKNEFMESVNSYFDQVYVINLQFRTDRRVKMVRKLERLGILYELVEAENGYSSENQDEFNAYLASTDPLNRHPLEKLYNRKLINSPGAWGYLKTYIKLLRQAREAGHKRILCFDDDVIFHKDFDQEFKKFITVIPADWKILMLGATQHVWKIPQSHWYPDKSKISFDPDESYYHPNIVDGSFAIGIDHSVFDLLIERCLNFNAPFDSGPMRDVIQLFPEKCVVAQPNLVIADVDNSDIGESRHQYELAEKVKWDMDLYDYPDNEDLVSVIISAYNSEDTIEKSIRSVLNQTYKNLEIIVSDDASTDGTVEVVRRLMKEDDRIRLITHDKNQGCYFVRNDGIRIAKGKYIAFQDADDISLKHRIARQLVPLVSGDALFSTCRIYRTRCNMDELDIFDEEAMLEQVEKRRKKNEHGSYEYHDRAVLGFISTIFKKSVFEECGLYWENRFASDAEFCERLLFLKAGIKLEEGENIHTLLMNCDPMPGLYKRIDEVLVLCAQMGEMNITNKYKQEQKKEFERTWRKKLEGEVDYEYPRLPAKDPEPNVVENEPVINWKARYRLEHQHMKLRITAKEQMLAASRKQIHNLNDQLAWYGRTYDHLPKWYLKIGGIFRRINLGK